MKWLEDEIKEMDGSHTLLDGGIIPGLSGAPVILYRELNGEILVDNFPPVILGTVAETLMAFMNKFHNETYYSYANLSFAFDVETIKEAIKLFYKWL